MTANLRCNRELKATTMIPDRNSTSICGRRPEFVSPEDWLEQCHDATTAEHITHATFAHWTADEFQAVKDRQILELLRWTAHLAAAGECGVVR